MHNLLQAVLRGWTDAMHSSMRAEAQALRSKVRAGGVCESDYRQQKESLASSLELNLQRLTREHFEEKTARIEEFEREAMGVYEKL